MRSLLTLCLLALGSSALAQTTVWYQNSSDVEVVSYSSSSQGIFTEDVTNPSTSGINGRATVSRFVKNSGASPAGYIRFRLPQGQLITRLDGLSFTFQGYTTQRTNNTDDIRFFLRNSTIGSASNISEASNFTVAGAWRQFSFDFSSQSMPASIIAAGGFDEIMIAVGQNDTSGTTYYLDRLLHRSTSTMTNSGSKADWLSGSWGTRLIVPGGAKMDAAAPSSDFVAGAQQMVAELPSVGHVITSFTHPAHGYFFCLRENAYVDIASEIHPDFVPSVENEQIILDVINVLRDAGKKVILYVATDGPSATGGTPDNAVLKAAWENYYNSTWGGNEYLAYRNLCKGFFERFDGLVDGYWLDHFAFFPGNSTQREDFVQMIRDIDPDVAIATNIDKSYFANAGNDIYVDTDHAQETIGVDGYEGATDSRDYKVVELGANDTLMDFTPGHPTPLGWGAPTSSWAYEEYTISDIVLNPYTTADGTRQVVKHFWVPMRETWTGAGTGLWFDPETAHRFVHRTISAGGGFTWANTMTNGYINPADLAVLKYVDQTIQAGTAPTPYSRPEGAYLVGETLQGFDQWIRSFPGHSDHTRAGDSDSDGESNLIEYAHGGDPTSADASVAKADLSIAIDATQAALVSYNRRKGTELTFEIEVSETIEPGSWSVFSAITESATDLSTDFERVTVYDLPPPSNAVPRLFMRLKVSD